MGRPAWWVRELQSRVRMVARHAGPPTSLVTAVGVLEDGPARTAAEATAALVAAGVCTGPVHPGGVLRAAQVLAAGCRAQLLAAGPDVVVEPSGRAVLVRGVMGAVVAADRRGDVVDLDRIATAAGVPVAAARVVAGRQPGWDTHDAGDGLQGSGAGRRCVSAGW